MTFQECEYSYMIVQSLLEISNFIYALIYLILLTGSGAEICLLTVQSRLNSKQPQWPASGTVVDWKSKKDYQCQQSDCQWLPIISGIF